MSRAPSTSARRPWITLSALAAVLFIAAVGILPAGATAPGGSAVPAAATADTWINLTVTDALAFAPTDPSSPTMAVTFEVRNAGTTDHTFTVSSRVNVTAPAGSNASSSAGSWFESAHVLIDVNVSAGQTVFANATFPTPGFYQFICRNHFPQMQGTVTVGMGSSSSSSPSSPYLLYGATGAIVLIVVVVATVWFLGRRKPKAPAAPPPSA